MNKYWPVVVAVTTLVLMLMAPLPVGIAQGNKGNGSNGNPDVIPPNARPYGKTYAEWSAEWFRWYMELPAFSGACPVPPYLDQSGKVGFFNNGCDLTVTPGTALFFPLPVSVECSSLEIVPGSYLQEGFLGKDAEEQRTCARFWADHIVEDSLLVEIDGVPVNNLVRYRFVSPQFEFTAPTPWIFGQPISGKGTSVADGYFLFLHPLPPGIHTIRAAGAIHISLAEGDPFDLDFGFDNTTRITVGH